LERAIIKCFNTIHSHKLKIVPITGGGESYGKIKLKEIASVIKNIKASSEAFKVFDKYLPKFKSVKLKKMVNSQDITKSLTNIFKDLEKCLIIKDGEP
jgi:DNA mismatch repair protein MSH6